MEEYRLYFLIGREVECVEWHDTLEDARLSASAWIREGQQQGIVEGSRPRIIPTGWKKPLEIWKPRRLLDDLLAERLEVVR